MTVTVTACTTGPRTPRWFEGWDDNDDDCALVRYTFGFSTGWIWVIVTIDIYDRSPDSCPYGPDDDSGGLGVLIGWTVMTWEVPE